MNSNRVAIRVSGALCALLLALPGFTQFGWLTVYIIAPIVGAVLGGGLYDFAIRPAHSDSKSS